MKKAAILLIVLTAFTAAWASAATQLVPQQYRTIQAAIDASTDGDTVIVAAGIYTGDGNRDIEFRGKAITLRSTDPNDPAIVAATIIDCNGTREDCHRGFYFHSGEDKRSILSGLTVKHAYMFSRDGCGIACNGSSPTITNCRLTENRGFYASGGGIWCGENSNPIINKCEISGNQGDGFGGGICCYQSSPTIGYCTIRDNSCDGVGGGIYCYQSSATISRCIIRNNLSRSCGSGGGGIYCRKSNAIISFCDISNNRAYERKGGGICCSQSQLSITHCRIVGNWAGETGGGIAADRSGLFIAGCTIAGNMVHTPGGGIDATLTDVTTVIVNCILWDNRVCGKPHMDFSQIRVSYAAARLSYSCVQGGKAGTQNTLGTLEWAEGNIEADPCFVQPGYWDANSTAHYLWDDFWVDGDYHLLAGSPCINAGDPNYVVSVGETDIDGEPRVFDGRIDIGADEFVPRVYCEMRFTPRALNLRSKGKYVKAHLLLPEGFAADDVDTDSPAVIEPLGIESERIKVVGGKQGRVEVSAVFARKAFCGQGDFDGSVSVEGLLKNGQTFYGTDQVKIIDRTSGQIAALASCWLRSDCRPPDWCDGLDINGDSVVNFVDFAGLNTCCIEAGVQ